MDVEITKAGLTEQNLTDIEGKAYEYGGSKDSEDDKKIYFYFTHPSAASVFINWIKRTYGRKNC